MRAPEFPQNLRWFNLPAQTGLPPAGKSWGGESQLQMKDLRSSEKSQSDRGAGKVVLIDFWTYSCVNCIRTLPHLKEWHEKYAKLGLVIIGVHTPEFEFEKDVSNVQAALKRFDITYPVVMDSDYQIWSLYSNNYWPRKLLVNKDGQIVYDHAGEGGYKETEEAIQKALLEIDPELKLPPTTKEDGSGGICLPTTPETYLGSMRGRYGKIWRTAGEWKINPEFIEHVGSGEIFEDYLALNFEASEVNLVAETKTERPIKLRLDLDGKFLKYLEIHEPKMYNLLSGSKQLRGELKIFTKDAGFRAYAFTFGGCAI